MKQMHRFLTAVAVCGLAASPVWSMDQGNVEKEVRRTLDNHYGTEARDITVSPEGKVVLKGTVPSYYDRLRQHNLVSRVRGVTAISNRLVVSGDPVPDRMIKSRIEAALELNSAIHEPDRIEVSVENGTVILSGDVSFYREARVAQDIASWTKGVRSVGNELRVAPPEKAVSDENITNIATTMIRRNFPIQAKTVSVTTESGNVTLTGTTTSLWAKNEIARSIRRIVGVTDVDNQMTVRFAPKKAS